MDGLVVITSYFNPCGYETRRRNYRTFMAGMRLAGVTCVTVECAFGDAPFELEPSLSVLQVRTQSLLWQKERLLNLAASWLPPSCRYVAWLDGDILFDNPSWPRDLVRVLQKVPVAQMFEACLRLDAHGHPQDRVSSFASVMRQDPALLNAGRYDLHGHTGYGWAMRRSLFDEVGLYEAAISGSADHFMAHAIYGNCNACIRNALKHDARQIAHLEAWSRRFHARVQGRLGVVPGTIQHLWHGDTADRRYFLRMHDITDMGYDPWQDIIARPGHPLSWAQGMNKPALQHYFARYFASRHEDGRHTETLPR